MAMDQPASMGPVAKISKPEQPLKLSIVVKTALVRWRREQRLIPMVAQLREVNAAHPPLVRRGKLVTPPKVPINVRHQLVTQMLIVPEERFVLFHEK